MKDFQDFIHQNKKFLAIFISAAFVVVIIFVIGFWLIELKNREGKLAVDVMILPSNAKVEIDGQRIKNLNGEIYLSPGEHKITAESDGFERHESTINVNDWHAPGIYIALLAQSDDAKKWQLKNQAKYKELELLLQKQSQNYGQKFNQRWPIVSSLPIKDPYFTISYRTDETTGEINLTIQGTSPRYREFAIKYLRQIGFEPTDYKIEFIGYKNPLTEGVDNG